MTEPLAVYTPRVMALAKSVRKLSIGELIALRDALKDDFDILPPDIGVRETRNRPSGGGQTAESDPPTMEDLHGDG